MRDVKIPQQVPLRHPGWRPKEPGCGSESAKRSLSVVSTEPVFMAAPECPVWTFAVKEKDNVKK